MAPPMPNSAKRFTANPARPVGRYRPGKAVQEEESDEEGFETEEEDTPVQPPPKQRPTTTPKPKEAAEIEEDEEGFVTENEEDSDTSSSGAEIAQTAHLPNTPHTSIPPPGEPTDTAQPDTASEESESESEESSEESEPEPARTFRRPLFISKTNRKNTAPIEAPTNSGPDPAEDSRRKAMAELMIKDELEKAAAARLAGKKYWDDDEDLAPEDMVDDTDGLDPELELREWQIRELKRLKRDRERIEAREKEIEEIERRRNLSKEEREREDAEYIAQQKEDKEGRGETGFMKKYYAKGAFFMDDENTKMLAERDIMGRTFQDEVDKSTLPEYMRIRDLSKLGKTGGTKYKDLRSEDTGRFGDEVKRWRPGDKARDADGTIGGVDERFMSDRDRERLGPTSSGANATAVGKRRMRSASRSQSPPRRKRSPSPYQERNDKRRRTEVDAR